MRRTPFKKKPDKKKVKKRRKLTIPRLRDKVCTAIKKYIKLRDSVGGYCQCITCGKMVKLGTSELHGGHYQHAKNRITYLIEDNINPQCSRCNLFYSGRLDKYTLWMVENYGEIRTQELIELNEKPHIWRRDVLDDLLEVYTLKLKELIKRREG